MKNMQLTKFSIMALIAITMLSFASASVLDVNITDDFGNTKYTGGSAKIFNYTIRDQNGVSGDDNWINAPDINCAFYFPTTAGTADGKWDGNFNPSCSDTNLSDNTTCTVTVTIRNPSKQDLVRYYPSIECTDKNSGHDINGMATAYIDVQGDCGVAWIPLIPGFVIVGILGLFGMMVIQRTGWAPLIPVFVIVIGASIALLLIQTLSCAG